MTKKAYFFTKRTFDIVASLAGLAITSPIWIFAILGIELSDPGPIFYRAMRIGKDNQEFVMWKFRSMRIPKQKSEKSESSFKADPNRIFAFGELMRRLKIDELPQLLNILGGTMSVVGPRPAAKDQVEIMRGGKYGVASSVRPGLTGPAALYDYIYGDSVEDLADYKRLVLPTRLELEAYYPQHMGILYDLKMIIYTAICIFASVLKKRPERILEELTACVSVGEKNKLEEASV